MADLQVKEIIKQMISYSSHEALDDMHENNMDISSFMSQHDQSQYMQVLETDRNQEEDEFAKTMANFRSKLVRNPQI